MTIREAMEELDAALSKTRNTAARAAWQKIKIEIIAVGLDEDRNSADAKCLKCGNNDADEDNRMGWCEFCEAGRKAAIDKHAGIIHIGSILGACGQRLTADNRTGIASKATCEPCRKAFGIASAFIGAATKPKRKRTTGGGK